MTEKQELARTHFAEQEELFRHWTKSYYQTALDLELLREDMGIEPFAKWLNDGFHADQVHVALDMIQKMRKTPRGKSILERYKQTGIFSLQ